MLVQISHEAPRGKRFDVFYKEKQLKSGEEYDLPENGLELSFIERNAVMSRFWFLRIFAAFLAGLVSGSFDDFADARRSRTEIRVLLGGIGEEIFIRFTGDGNVYSIEGARETREISNCEKALPQAEKRLRVYRVSLFALAALAAAGVLVWLVSALL